jgi:hypothetical protein
MNRSEILRILRLLAIVAVLALAAVGLEHTVAALSQGRGSALVEVEKMGRIGKMAIKMGKVSTAGIPIGVRIAHRDHDAGHGQHRRGDRYSGDRRAIEPVAR